MTYILHSDVNSLSFNPNPEMIRGGQRIGSVGRAGDNLYGYAFSSYETWELPVAFVDSEFMSIANSWWSVGQNLTLLTNDSISFSVTISNESMPINKYVATFDDLFRGTLLLHES